MEDFDFTDADLKACPCVGTGWLGREWLEKREPQCSCEAQSADFMHVIHDLSCDSVPCPFCPLEAGYAEDQAKGSER